MPSGLGERPAHDLICWPTYALGELQRIGRDQINAALVQRGFPSHMDLVLASLDDFDPPFQQVIAEQIPIDRSDLAKLLGRLEADGHLTRRRDPTDRRRWLLSLTASGHRVLRETEAISLQVTESVLGRLTSRERQTLHRLTLKALGESVLPVSRELPETG